MGKILQIRVMAYTYDETEVKKAWPKLYTMAFPEQYPAPSPLPPRGVFELVDAIVDQVRFDMVDTNVKPLLEPGAERIKNLKDQMEQALSDWNPKQANTLSDKLELALDDLEKEAPNP